MYIVWHRIFLKKIPFIPEICRIFLSFMKEVFQILVYLPMAEGFEILSAESKMRKKTNI